jgi:hypothetical protein
MFYTPASALTGREVILFLTLSSVDPLIDEVVPLFDPRRDMWDEHFRLNTDTQIEGTMPKCPVTSKLLDFNNPERVTIRAALMALRRYPRDESADRNLRSTDSEEFG